MAENNSHTSRLPTEVWREITQFLAASIPCLLSTSLTSRALREEAQRLLFRHPSQLFLQQEKSKTTLQVIHSRDRYPAFIDAILSSPDRLGPLVKTYTHQQSDNADPEYLEKVNRALRSMPNLRRLAFSGEKLPSSVLDECTFQLDAFRWAHEGSPMEILQHFLPTQSSLKHLTFPCPDEFASEETIALAGSVCPKLESLTGSRATIDLFVKGRKLIYLQWGFDNSYGSKFIPAQSATHKPLEGLDNELSQIQYLTFIPTWASQLPSELLEKLQSLVLLEASTQAIGGKDNLILLSKLSTLRVLILHDSMIGSDVAPLELVREILTCCRHLLYIDIEIRRLVYQRFTQASLASTPMQGPILTDIGIDTPYSSPYVRKFTSISEFDGIDHFSELGGINFQRDFGHWFQPTNINIDQEYDASSLFPPNDINFERDFGQWFHPESEL